MTGAPMSARRSGRKVGGPDVQALRILVADDLPVVREGLRHLVATRPLWEICGEAANEGEALSLAFETRPDVAVIALSLPAINGVSVTRSITESGLETRVLLYSSHHDDQTIAAGLAAGARGCVLKMDSVEQVENAIEALGARRRYISPSVAEVMKETWTASTQDGLKAFTARELEVTQLIAEGLSNRKIAELLNRSVKTIESHRNSIMRKAGVHSTAGLVRFAIRNGLTQP